jgi:nitronate monooxygenase
MLGEHIASALSMGASGAVFGTRFLLSEESCYGREKKEAIRCVEVGGTERSDAWDKAIGKGWPGTYAS